MNNIITQIQSLIKNAIIQPSSPISSINRVYYGDPIIINESSLPAIAIQPKNTVFNQRGSRYDQKTHTIEIRLIYNGKDYLKSPTSLDIVEATRGSIRMIEETSGFETINYSICGIIQKNSTLNGVCNLASVVNVDYTFSEVRGYPSYEVIVTIKCEVIGNR